MFYVRKEAASAIGSLATVVTPDIVIGRLVSHFRFHYIHRLTTLPIHSSVIAAAASLRIF